VPAEQAARLSVRVCVVRVSLHGCRLACGQEHFVSRNTHHFVHWGEALAFSAPSCRGHAQAEHEGCLIKVTLSTGARLKMRQEHVSSHEKGKLREVWLACKSAQPGAASGNPLELLVRLVHLGKGTPPPPHTHTHPDITR
jgi:hypothetical protein